MVVTKALDALGLHWKRDPDFQPVKDAATLRLHVAVGGQVFDTRADKGGGGAIDLAMHLLRLDFVAAVGVDTEFGKNRTLRLPVET